VGSWETPFAVTIKDGADAITNQEQGMPVLQAMAMPEAT
jgi:hypothetical protein